MSFTESTGLILLGLGVIGAILAGLQILRVRHREVPVATTIFWRQAIEEARARVFRQRFRHPAAWLLFFVICALLWLGFSGPRWGTSGRDRTVCLLDRSAAMEGRLEGAVERLLADVPGLPAASTQVLVVGGPTSTVLEPGEDPLHVKTRLASLRCDQAPSRIAEVVRELALEGDEPLTIRVYGDAPLPAAGTLPAHVTVLRATTAGGGNERAWRLTALGQAQAASGRTDAVDVLVELRGPSNAAAPPVRFTTETGALRATPARLIEGPGLVRLSLEDLSADGRTVHVHGGDGERPLGSIVLAVRPVLRVAVDEELRARFEPVIAADAGLAPADGEADVIVSSGPRSAGVPVLSVVAAADAEHAIGIQAPGDDAARILAEAEGDLALAEIDGAAVARATGSVISVGASLGERRAISIRRALLAPDAAFVDSRAFPLFVAKALRWLAGQATLHPVAAAGEPMSGTRWGQYLIAAEGKTLPGPRLHPVGGRFTPPRAGRYADSDGGVFHASWIDAPGESRPGGGDTPVAAAPSVPPSLLSLFLLAALGLLGVEWFLFRTARVP